MPRNIRLSGWNTKHKNFPKLLSGETEHISYDYSTLDVDAAETSATAFRPVATEDELLGFANAVRQAGGGQALPHLVNSTPGAAKACLIAKAVNFESAVQPGRGRKKTFADGSKRWVMETSEEVAVKINEYLGLEVEKGENYDFETVWRLYLPIHIGNAAQAFDEKLAFQKYDSDHVALSDPYSFKDKSTSYIQFDKIDPFKIDSKFDTLDTKVYGFGVLK